MKINASIVQKTASYVSNYFSKHLDKDFLYHNLVHTIYVKKAVEKLCPLLDLSKHQKAILLIAAWFHDLGYTQKIEDHESVSASHAEEFLLKNNIDHDDIGVVKSCILSTRFPQKPTTLFEKILCDADLMHLADENFFELSELLRKEWEMTLNKKYSDIEWIELDIHFIANHHFHTEYCLYNLEKGKSKNMQKLTDKLSVIKNKVTKLQMNSRKTLIGYKMRKEKAA